MNTHWKCRLFGHKWLPVIINKRGKWKFVAVYCERCLFGEDELLKFLADKTPIINSYDFKYWYE